MWHGLKPYTRSLIDNTISGYNPTLYANNNLRFEGQLGINLLKSTETIAAQCDLRY